MALSDNTQARIDMLCRGLVVGAVITAFAGTAAYLGLLPSSLSSKLTLYGRAAGMFKDPNVFGAYLALPALLVMQRVVSVDNRRTFLNIILLGIISMGVFLAFSRAAWGLLVMSGAMMLVLMTITSQTDRERTRIILIAITGAVAAVAMLTVLLSFDFISDMFEQRASLKQGYDSGRFGRFGRHLLGAQMALEMPFGIGPLQFSRYFPEDTHNSYLNAFMSGGWISGIFFPALVLITLMHGFRTIFIRTPWQRPYIAVYATFVGTVGEAAIIDIDHWRHFWMMLGLVWGMSIATHQFMSDRAASLTTAADDDVPGAVINR